MNNRPWEIYTLSDPITGEVRYVGVTFRRKARIREHMSRAVTGGKTHRDCWIRSLILQGLRPLYTIVEAGEGKGWETSEQTWIAHYRLATRLVNHTNGGEGLPGYIPTEALRQKWSTMRAGVPYAPGRIPGMLGKTHTPEARAKISAASKTRRHTASSKAKLSAAHTGKKLSPAHIAKLSAAKKGTKATPEARAKMSASKHNKQPVRCIETGETFASITDAARQLAVNEASIYQAIRKGCRCKGFHWQRLSPSTTSKP